MSVIDHQLEFGVHRSSRRALLGGAILALCRLLNTGRVCVRESPVSMVRDPVTSLLHVAFFTGKCSVRRLSAAGVLFSSPPTTISTITIIRWTALHWWGGSGCGCLRRACCDGGGQSPARPRSPAHTLPSPWRQRLSGSPARAHLLALAAPQLVDWAAPRD